MESSAPRMVAPRSEGADSPWSALSPLAQEGACHRDVADGSEDPAATEGYDLLRTQMQQACAAREWTRIAVAQAGADGHAAAATALNLALSQARLPHRGVVLVDLDLERQPVSRLLSASLPSGAVEISAAAISARLALLRVTGTRALGAAETILSPAFRSALDRQIGQMQPDLVLFNVPPLLAGDAGLAALELAHAVVLAIHGRADTAADVRLAETRIAGRCPLLGLFLFDAEG